MRSLLNLLWFVFGGWLAALAWCLAGMLMAVTVIGLPWARACWEIAALNLHPFGREAVGVGLLRGGGSPVSGLIGLIANILWLPLGILLFVLHVAHALALAITIIGIPFAVQHFKLALISLAPVGKRVVRYGVAEAARWR